MRDAWRSYAAGSDAKHFAEFAREHLIHERLERIADRGRALRLAP
jgi:hypothetical protein